MAESSTKEAENTVGKREIARYEQFLLFPQCFSTDSCCRQVKTRAESSTKEVENTVEKREIARYE